MAGKPQRTNHTPPQKKFSLSLFGRLNFLFWGGGYGLSSGVFLPYQFCSTHRHTFNNFGCHFYYEAKSSFHQMSTVFRKSFLLFKKKNEPEIVVFLGGFHFGCRVSKRVEESTFFGIFLR
jgi:hypothetical protein